MPAVYKRFKKVGQMRVYLDYAATSPVKPEVRKAILPYLAQDFGNPSSIHSWGRKARQAIDEAREKLAKLLNCKVEEIIFTAGGTEADNLAIQGLVSKYWENRERFKENGKQYGKQKSEKGKSNFQFPTSKPISNFQELISLPHIITSQFEHHAVLKTCEILEKEKKAKVTYLKPNREGIIEVESVRQAINPNTVLVTIMYVNNEIGTLQPIREIGKMIETENKKRVKEGRGRIYFHTDAVQAVEYFPTDVNYLHVDLLTLAGHKIGAPKGIGALYIRKSTPVSAIIFGGGQEGGYRAGTENVAGIVGLGKAAEIIINEKKTPAKIQKLSEYFIDRILKEIPETELNGSRKYRSPANVNLYFKHIEGESIVLSLDLEQVAVSTGSACTSLALEPSHVILSVFDDPKRAAGSVRFSLGHQTTRQELDFTIGKLKKVIKHLRKISPYGQSGQKRG